MRDRAITAYLGMGATAIVAYLVLPDGAQSVIWAAIAFSAPIAIVIGIRRFRPARPAPWYLLAAGLAFYAFGDVLWNIFDGGAAVAPGVAAYAVGYPLMGLGCLFLVRSDRRTSMLAMVDALVGACGMAVILWVVLLSDGVEGSGVTFAMLVNASYHEFVIVVEDVRDDEQAEASAARFLEEVRRPVVLGGAKVTLGASLGLVVATGQDTPDDILRRADTAMYDAKRSGRGGWRRFEAETSAGLGA